MPGNSGSDSVGHVYIRVREAEKRRYSLANLQIPTKGRRKSRCFPDVLPTEIPCCREAAMEQAVESTLE